MAEKKVSKEKLEQVKKLVELIKQSNTIIIASIKNLPSRQFQLIRKKLKEKAEIIVTKKRIMLKAIEESSLGKTSEKTAEAKEKTSEKTAEAEAVSKLKEYVQEDTALLFSKEDAFELASLLAENKNPIKAKPGQEALEDIEVEEGPTDLIPGPVISELGALGIKIAVEEGKIAIKEKKVIVKKGEKINEAAASIMAKLDIMPFEIGLEPIAVYESKAGKIYLDVKIDKKATVEELQSCARKALGFAQKIAFYCKETIGYLLAKANADSSALEKLAPEEKKEEPKAEGKAENTDEKKEEIKEKNQVQKTEETKSEEEK